MKINNFFLTIFIGLIILLLVFYAVKRLAVAQTPRSLVDVFTSRPAWKELPSDFLRALANRLNSVEKASEFAQVCEGTGILKNNIVGLVDLAHGDTEFAIGGVAITLTSQANAMGKQKQYGQAKRVLELALLLKPRHRPAWESMAITAVALGDCQAAVYWADKVLAFKPDPNTKDYYEWATGELGTVEGEMRYAKMFEDPEAIGALKKTQEIMKEIKDACGK